MNNILRKTCLGIITAGLFTATAAANSDIPQNAVQVTDPVELQAMGLPAGLAESVYRVNNGEPTATTKSNFGPNSSYTAIPGTAFQRSTYEIGGGFGSKESFADTLGCKPIADSQRGFFDAPVILPSGVQLTRVESIGRDGGATSNVGTTLWRRCYAGADAQPIVDLASHSSGLADTPGAFLLGTDLLTPETINNKECNYYLHVSLSSCAAGFTETLNRVVLHWNRQIAPAPATPTFFDVPQTHQFYQGVEALAGSGITGGCGGGNYCPDDFISRGQMAAFLSRAMGLHFADH